MNKQKGRVCSVCEAAYAEQDSDMCNRCSVDIAQQELHQRAGATTP